jgi:hypothetical protein
MPDQQPTPARQQPAPPARAPDPQPTREELTVLAFLRARVRRLLAEQQLDALARSAADGAALLARWRDSTPAGPASPTGMPGADAVRASLDGVRSARQAEAEAWTWVPGEWQAWLGPIRPGAK